ncbi:hypothetical protein HR08_05315 [Porphyromonas gulae]|uniref:Uncharacterized protein n=1 Tax=Porphyromonas gulae TaxID=111105 RepID=A0A0A2F6M8_9PORP|nr:hypothetical protein HR08_05315 [Porphyromonas gulae]
MLLFACDIRLVHTNLHNANVEIYFQRNKCFSNLFASERMPGKPVLHLQLESTQMIDFQEKHRPKKFSTTKKSLESF